MLSPEERQEIRSQVHQELAEIEDDVAHRAGSYNYLCEVAGDTIFTHQPVGAVLRSIPHAPQLQVP